MINSFAHGLFCSPVLNIVFPFASVLRCSSRPAANEVIGIDLGTTNSCVAVMEGKVKHNFFFLLLALTYWHSVIVWCHVTAALLIFLRHKCG